MRRGLILEHHDFRRLWIGETLSQLGTQVSLLAIPLTALATLHANAFQVSLLRAAQTGAFLLLGLPAGAWIDRTRRRPVLITGDLGRAALLASLPAAAALGLLHLDQLYLVVFTIGICTLFFDVAYQSYLPFLVGRQHLVDGNGRLEASRSTAYLIGPAIAGYLTQALTPPVAVLLDAVTFCWSAAWIAAIGHREPHTSPPHRRSLRREIAEGLRVVFGRPELRALGLYNATTVLFLSMGQAIGIVFLVRTIGLSPSGIGLLYAVSSTGAVAGAFAGPMVSRRLGPTRTILIAAALWSIALLLIPLASRGPGLAFYAIGGAISAAFLVTYNITAVAYRQSLCPDRLLGRMNATMRFLAWGATPAGSMLGGVLATVIGTRSTLWLSAAGCTIAVTWLLTCPPLRKASPTQADPQTIQAG